MKAQASQRQENRKYFISFQIEKWCIYFNRYLWLFSRSPLWHSWPPSHGSACIPLASADTAAPGSWVTHRGSRNPPAHWESESHWSGSGLEERSSPQWSLSSGLCNLPSHKVWACESQPGPSRGRKRRKTNREMIPTHSCHSVWPAQAIFKYKLKMNYFWIFIYSSLSKVKIQYLFKIIKCD